MRVSQVRSRVSRARGITAQQLPSNHLVVMAVTSGRVAYEFTVDGSVTKSTHGGTEIEHISAESGNDDIVQNADGTVTVIGETGNWHGDAYRINGEVTDFTVTGQTGPFRIIQNGEDVTEQMLNGGDNGEDNGSNPGSELPVSREQAAIGVLGVAGAYMFIT